MSEVIILLNDVIDGMRRLHIMSDAPIGEEQMAQVPVGLQVNRYQDEIRLYHLEAIWVPRGDLVRFERQFACGADCPVCHGKGCAWHLQLTLFMLEKDERVSQAIEAAAVEYALKTGNDPMYAWVRNLPKGIEYGAEVKVNETVMVNLYSAYWMPDRAVAVGRGN